MPASHKSDRSTKGSKITKTLKRKASKVIKAILPKKKKRGLTDDDTVSVASTLPKTPTQTGDSEPSNESTVINIDSDTGDEDADAELGTSSFIQSYWCCEIFLLTLILSERLKKDWTAPIYAFYQPIPSIDHDNGRRFHEFTCAAKGCKKKIQRYLDKKDSNSTGNLRKHAKQCWGAETLAAADQTKNVSEARASVTNLVSKNGSITAIFERLGKAKVTYSHRQHTKTEAKFVTSP
jgi:hypothetical protein